jgi:UDP-3-O-[3-hydroxymyristoyl] N-acetylglucosamine deacetylase
VPNQGMAKIQEQQLTASLTAAGISSREQITVSATQQPEGHGIVFRVPATGRVTGAVRTGTAGGAMPTDTVDVPARADHVVSTLRNVTIGSKTSPTRLSLVEHFLCAAAIWGLTDLLIEVDGPELPLADGSARLWIDMFRNAGWQQRQVSPHLTLKEPVICRKGDRVLMALPDDAFSATYMIDWHHPMIGRKWYTWDPGQTIEDLSDARTFGSLEEHRLLGIADNDIVSMTADGFNQPLRFPDEPVRHKVLDLVGDLMLVGVNPLSWKARFISIKGGHELDVEMAKALLAAAGSTR